MQRSNFEERHIRIRAAEALTEIFLMRADLKRIASGLGEIETSIPVGLYKIRFRSGPTQFDKLVEVASGADRLEIQGESINFPSIAPISMADEWQDTQALAAKLCATNGASTNKPGAGDLMLFLRTVTPGQALTESYINSVSIQALDGEKVIELREGQRSLEQGWAGGLWKVPPGTYAIRVHLPPEDGYEMFVTVPRYWQTQVFLVLDEVVIAGRRLTVPTLKSASVMYAHEFDPDARSVRLSELARYGVAQGRDLVSRQLMQELLHGKFEAPVLGLYAAEMLLRRRPRNRELLKAIARNLDRILPDNPDVQALRIAAFGLVKSGVDTIKEPPTLRSSWDIINQSSKNRAGLVPIGCPNHEISANALLSSTLLLHRVKTEGNEEYKNLQQGQLPTLKAARQATAELIGANIDEPGLVVQTIKGSAHLSGLENSLLRSIANISEKTRLMNAEATKGDAFDLKLAVRQAIGTINATPYAVAEAAISLNQKFMAIED